MAEQVLKNTAATLSVVFSAGYADGQVTVTMTDPDGATVTSGAAVLDGAVSGRYTYVLDPQPTVMHLSAVWAGVWGGTAMSIPAEIEIVGNLLFTIDEIRAFGDKALKDPTKYPDELLAESRTRAAEIFENFCGVSFVPRYARHTLDGRYFHTVILPDERITQILAVTVDGVPLTTDQLAELTLRPGGRVERRGYYGWWAGDRPGNVIISYEHGWTTPPLEITRAAMILVRDELTANILASRFISMQNELGVVREAAPNPTGIRIVDATLARYDETPAFAVY